MVPKRESHGPRAQAESPRWVGGATGDAPDSARASGVTVRCAPLGIAPAQETVPAEAPPSSRSEKLPSSPGAAEPRAPPVSTCTRSPSAVPACNARPAWILR